MRKFLILGATVAALGLLAVASPANAADHKANGVTAGQTVQMDLSARRYHRRYYRRYYRGYYGGGPYYYRPYYRPYPYYYGPRYYSPYGYSPYYRRPGIYFGFGF
jgi:hypothetical protein